MTPWSDYADDITEIEIGKNISVIGANSLTGFGNLKEVKISDDVQVIAENALPENNFTIKGYLNSAAEKYAKDNGKDFKVSMLRILSIGNSHTYDYQTWKYDIKADLQKAGMETDFLHSVTVFGGRQLFTDSGDTVNSHLTAATTPSYKDYETYRNTLNGSLKWDLIILQDYHEASLKDNSNFTSGMAEAVKWIRAAQPQAKIAWVADWAEKASYSLAGTNNLEGVYANIVAAMNAVNNMTENKPDFIIPMSTAMQNVRSSYLGGVNNAKDSYFNTDNTDWAWNRDKNNPISYIDQYSVLERDTTHCSYELGRYAMGIAVYAHILEAFKDVIDVPADFDYYGALKTAPVATGLFEWNGEFTDSIWSIVKEAAKNSLTNKFAVTQSVYTKDPADEIAADIKNASYANVDFNTKSALATEINRAANGKVTVSEADIAVDGNNATITFLYGYTKKTVQISK